MALNLIVLGKEYSIYKFSNQTVLPSWIYTSDFYSITGTKDELSVVAAQNDNITDNIKCNKNWRILKICGPLDFSLVGIVADLTCILKEEKIPVFIISTYDTDHILMKQKDLNNGIKALTNQGYTISEENQN
jgi:uncharacterized protein